MVVFQRAADRGLHGVIPQTSCQRLSCVMSNTRGAWQQSNGQMGPVSRTRDGMDGGWMMNLWLCIDLYLAHIWVYAAKQTRVKAPFSHFYGANPVATNGHTHTRTHVHTPYEELLCPWSEAVVFCSIVYSVATLLNNLPSLLYRFFFHQFYQLDFQHNTHHTCNTASLNILPIYSFFFIWPAKLVISGKKP